MELHKFVGIEIFNSSGIGIILGNNQIPVDCRGKVIGYSNDDKSISLKWYEENKPSVSVDIKISLFEKLFNQKIIDFATNHIVAPEPLYDIGDLVTDNEGRLKGLIKSRNYEYGSSEWWYNISSISETIIGVHSDIRECESDLIKVTELNTKVIFKKINMN